MEKETINDIAQILEDIKKDQAEDVLTEKSKPKEMSIDDLIKRLQDKKKQGYRKVKVDGWLYADKDGVSDMIATNSLYG